jgi:hypothetical protein
MRRQWFEVFRISTKENPADLNTKALSRERREFLMKRIGLVSEVFGGDESRAEETACETAGEHDHGEQLARMWRRTLAWTSSTKALEKPMELGAK